MKPASYMRPEDKLNEEEALAIYNAIMNGSEEGLKIYMKNALQVVGEIRTWREKKTISSEYNDHTYYVDGDPPQVNPSFNFADYYKDQLTNILGRRYRSILIFSEILQEKHTPHGSGLNQYVSIETKVDLVKLASLLPNKVVFEDFELKPEVRAKKYGYSIEDIKAAIKASYKGSIGIPGQEGFTIILDATGLEKYKNYAHVIGASDCFPAHYTQDFIRSVEANPPTGGKICERYQQLPIYRTIEEKGLLDKPIILINEQKNPATLRLLAEWINFQGASHYIAKNKSRSA